MLLSRGLPNKPVYYSEVAEDYFQIIHSSGKDCRCYSVAKSWLTLWNPMDCSTAGSFTISQSLLKPMSIESVMPSNHLVPLSFPSPPVFNLSQHQSLFQWVSSCIKWPKFWRFSCSISPSNEYSGLISFRIDWFDLLVVQRPLKSLLQPHSSKASILLRSAFFMVQLSHLYMTTGKTIALTIWTFWRRYYGQ